jgi:hypothetical protein
MTTHEVQYLPVGILSSLIMVINIFFTYRKHHRVLQLLHGSQPNSIRFFVSFSKSISEIV